jgi:SH3 domain-containing YSC84-like protein 1
MKKTSNYIATVILTLAALFVVSVSPLRAADNQADIENRLAASAKVLDEVMADPSHAVPEGVIKRATCVAVFPATVQVAVLVGAKHGKGFVTCRTSNGWSAPAPLTVSGGSWGAQLGEQQVDLVMVLTNDKGLQELLAGKFNLGTETSVTAGPVGNNEWKMNEEVLTYARARGVFAGFNLTGSQISQDEDDTRILYGTPASLSDVLTGKTRPAAGSQPFLDTVEKYAGMARARA